MIKVKRLHKDAKIPARSRHTDAGYDLFSIEDVMLPQHSEATKIRTGVAISPPPGYYAHICERSGLGSEGIAIRGGVCDESYTGEYIVLIQNLSPLSPRKICKGDKIAQVVFKPYGSFEIEEVDELDQTDRGDKGFGSSGS